MFRFGSKKDVSTTEFKCTIRLLEDNEVLQCDFTKEHNGQYLLDYSYKNLGLVEKDYFGLRFVDSQKQRNWLDPNRPIYKQVKGLSQIVFCFRVKFYPTDVDSLKDETTRFLLYLQLRRDLQHGRLYCSTSELAYLIACILQSELGDYEPLECGESYAEDLNLVPKRENLDRALDEAKSLHRTEMAKKNPADVEQLFLKKAATLDTYGVDPQPVKDQKGIQLYLGINHSGILTFQVNRKTHHFKWIEVRKVNYEGRMFIVHLVQQSQKKSYIGFKCNTVASCHYIWRCAVEQRYFFTMSSSSEVPQITTGGGFFFRQAKLQFSGRVQREILAEGNLQNGAVGVQRSQSVCNPASKSMARSNTIHLGQSTKSGLDSSSVLDDSNVNHRYANTSSRSEPDELRARCDTPAAGSSVNVRTVVGRSNLPFRSQSAAAGQKFDLRPDLTPTEAEHEFPLPVGSMDSSKWSSDINAIGSNDSRSFLQSSPSHNNPLPDLDEDADETLVNDQRALNEKYSGSGGGIFKQRSDSATRKKLTRQEATIVEQFSGNATSATNQNLDQRSSKHKKFWSILRTAFISLILFAITMVICSWILFEWDISLLKQWRQIEEIQLIRENLYQPTREWLNETANDFKDSLHNFAATYLPSDH